MKVFTLVAHSAAFGLIEIGMDGGYSSFRLSRNAVELGQIEFPSPLSPKISVSQNGDVGFYGGCNVYLHVNGELRFFEEQEEVSSLWFVRENLFLKCDTLLVSRRISDLSVEREYWHSEIITTGVLQGSDLFYFQDLKNRIFELDLGSFVVRPSDYPFIKLA